MTGANNAGSKIEYSEIIMRIVFMLCALTAVVMLFIIIFFIFSRGVPAIIEVALLIFSPAQHGVR